MLGVNVRITKIWHKKRQIKQMDMTVIWDYIIAYNWIWVSVMAVVLIWTTLVSIVKRIFVRFPKPRSQVSSSVCKQGLLGRGGPGLLGVTVGEGLPSVDSRMHVPCLKEWSEKQSDLKELSVHSFKATVCIFPSFTLPQSCCKNLLFPLTRFFRLCSQANCFRTRCLGKPNWKRYL